MIARLFTITGTVQGVGYRYFAQRSAARHQVTGYVRNLVSGEVEVLAEGAVGEVEAFRHDLSVGPIGSSVEMVREDVLEPTGRFGSFRVEK